MGIFDDLMDKLVDELSGDAERRRKQEELDDFNKKYSLGCRRCRGLAQPILGTNNRYRCGCGNQFAGAHHGG